MELSREVLEKVEELANDHELDLVILYGSTATGKRHSQSDTDIAVKAKHVLSKRELLTLSQVFDSLFVDSEVVDLRNVTPLLGAAIQKDGVLLYERKKGDFIEFKLYAWKQYIDFKWFVEQSGRVKSSV